MHSVMMSYSGLDDVFAIGLPKINDYTCAIAHLPSHFPDSQAAVHAAVNDAGKGGEGRGKEGTGGREKERRKRREGKGVRERREGEGGIRVYPAHRTRRPCSPL